MNLDEIVAGIERVSRREVIRKLGGQPEVWYTGGSQHNDYRLFAEEYPDGRVRISDASGNMDIVDAADFPSLDEIRAYVADWLDETMPSDEED